MSHDHSHGHSHSHAHVGGGGADVRHALVLALVLNGVFLVVEAGVGWWANSLALLSDAAHMVSDVGALALALGAAQLARRPASTRMTFGLIRAETLGAFLNGVALTVACGVIVFEAVHRVVEGVDQMMAAPIVIVGTIGLLINLGSAWFLYRSDRDNLNVRGALAHMLADALGSVGAIVAGVFVAFGQPLADPIVSVLIAALVGVGAWSVLRDSGRVLLQLPPPGLDVQGLTLALRGLDGVASVHDLHAWSLEGRDAIVTAHVVLRGDTPTDEVFSAAVGLLQGRFGVEHATLQLEREDGTCATVACGTGSQAAR